jgi:hypothetical protein
MYWSPSGKTLVSILSLFFVFIPKLRSTVVLKTYPFIILMRFKSKPGLVLVHELPKIKSLIPPNVLLMKIAAIQQKRLVMFSKLQLQSTKKHIKTN